MNHIGGGQLGHLAPPAFIRVGHERLPLHVPRCQLLIVKGGAKSLAEDRNEDALLIGCSQHLNGNDTKNVFSSKPTSHSEPSTSLPSSEKVPDMAVFMSG